MSRFYVWIVVLSTLQNYALCSYSCGEMKHVVSQESGDILLRVDKPGVIEISWVVRNTFLAITKPHGSMEVKSRQYKSRLYNGTNGSLNITKLTKDDQGEFVANVRLGEEGCNQIYNLTVYNVMCEGQCSNRSITGAVGGAVTLPVGRTEVRSFVWSLVAKEGAIATTSPGGSTSILQEPYEGRLSSTSDGSLIITKLRQEDQGTYLAQFSKQKCFYHLTVFSNLTAEDVTISSNVTYNKTCEVSLTCSVNGSNVTITWRSMNSSDITGTQNVIFVPPRNINFIYICTAENPVSNASKAVHPWEYCKGVPENTPKEDYTMVNLIRLVISVCVLLISCFIFIHHLKTEVITQRPRTDII